MSRVGVIAVAALALAAVVAASFAPPDADDSKSQSSPLEMHRTGVSTDDGTGWYLAESTLGNFTVSLPGPFNDYTIRVEDPNIGLLVTNNVGFKLPDGFQVMVSKMHGTEKSNVIDLDGMLDKLKQGPMGKDIAASQKTMIDGLPALDVTVKGPERSAHILYLAEGKTLYSVSVECPIAMTATCGEVSDKMRSTFQRKSK